MGQSRKNSFNTGRTLFDATAVGLVFLVLLTVRIDRTVVNVADEKPESPTVQAGFKMDDPARLENVEPNSQRFFLQPISDEADPAPMNPFQFAKLPVHFEKIQTISEAMNQLDDINLQIDFKFKAIEQEESAIKATKVKSSCKPPEKAKCSKLPA